jgi:DNA-directed RNA polymerase subunit M/transcription elongation factor TFIIS
MKFCSKCERVLVRDTSSGEVRFSCTVCGETVTGDAYDTRVGGGVIGAGETTEMYKRLIQISPFDRVNQLVFRQCDKCGLDYMTQIRVGDGEAIVYTCKCGSIISGEAAFRLMDTTSIENILPGAKVAAPEKKEDDAKA